MFLKKALTVISIALVAGLMAMMPVSAKEARVIKMSMQPSCTSLAMADIDERPAAGMMLSYKEKGEMNKVIWLLLRLDGIYFSLVIVSCVLLYLTSGRNLDDFLTMLFHRLRLPFALCMVIVVFRLIVNIP